ncbi:hypothetical protein CSUB01_12251, partial [Colletotrichum sublineola]
MIGLLDESFSACEVEELAKATFTAKEKQILSIDNPLAFNGGIVTLTADGKMILKQKGQGKKLRPIDLTATDTINFDYSVAAQHQVPQAEEIKALNWRIKWQMDNPNRSLTFQLLDLAAAKLFVFVDGSFANNKDMTSQLGFLITLANEITSEGPDNGDEFTMTGNIVYFSLTKCKRVTRSVLASEVYGMVAGADMAYAISTTLKMVTDRMGLPLILTIL